MDDLIVHLNGRTLDAHHEALRGITVEDETEAALLRLN